MPEALKIIQLTDLHIGREGEDTYHIDVRQNFRRALEHIQQFQPDFLVLSGDLCYQNGDLDILRWVKSQTLAPPFPTFAISGNHDDSVLLAKAFDIEHDLHGEEVYFHFEYKTHHFIFLDTGKGVCSAAQYNWLKQKLEQPNAVVFMHHPPVVAGVPFMDVNYPFQEMEAMQTILCGYGNILPIFCGHYHVDKVILDRNLLVHITPSTFFQIDQHSPTFKVDHRRIGFREIVFENGKLSSTVHYLP